MKSKHAEATGCGGLSSVSATSRFAEGRRESSRPYARRGPISMATYVITHEVDDVEHWLSSPKREEVFGPMGITVRTFRDPDGSNKTALIAEIPDMKAFQDVMKSEAAADAMKHDGVNPETLLIFSEA
jgi:hypothetical protein